MPCPGSACPETPTGQFSEGCWCCFPAEELCFISWARDCWDQEFCSCLLVSQFPCWCVGSLVSSPGDAGGATRSVRRSLPLTPPSLHPSRSLPARSFSTTTAPMPSTGGCEVREGTGPCRHPGGDAVGLPPPAGSSGKRGWRENGRIRAGSRSLWGRVVTAQWTGWLMSRFSLSPEYKVRPFCCKERPPARGGSPRDVSLCPQAPQGEALPSACSALPSPPSILHLTSSSSRNCGGQSRVPPLLPGPKCLAEQDCPPAEEQSRGVVLLLSCSRSCLGRSWCRRVSRLFQSHHGDSGWIRVTLRAIPTSPCPTQAPGSAVPPKPC